MAAKRGAVLLIGAAARGEVDLTPVWFKELDILGSSCHGVDAFNGNAMHSFARAIEILSSSIPLQRVVTHVFPLEELQVAIDTAGARSAGVIKVLLEVNPPWTHGDRGPARTTRV
jgi:threonine dehydrogenase-like Zn-dependent dehydrogenase